MASRRSSRLTRKPFRGSIDGDRLLDYVIKNRFSLQQVRAFLLEHSDLALIDCFIHEADEIAAISGVGTEQVKAIFHALGMVPGHLKGRDPKRFLLDNPVWTAPWIALSESSVFACVPQTALSFLFGIVERLVAANEQLKGAWHARRAAFLEEEIAASLFRALPDAAVYIFDRVIQVSSHRWSEIAIALLDIDDDGQKMMEREIRNLVKKHRNRKTTPRVNTIVYIPGGVGWTAVAAVVLCHADITYRRHAARAAVAQAFQDPRPSRCLVLVYDADAHASPYDFLLLADRLHPLPE